MRGVIRGSQRPKRRPFVVYWMGVIVKAAFVMATTVGLWKLTSMFIMWVHPWP